MAHHRGLRRRVLNLSRNSHLKLHQAQERIAAGTAVWVQIGISLRELTLAEILARRLRHHESGQPLPYRNVSNELPGLVFQPPPQDVCKWRDRWPLLIQAAALLRDVRGCVC